MEYTNGLGPLTNNKGILFQSDFSSGIISSTFYGNFDLEIVKQSVRECVNLDYTPYEGLTTRLGTMLYDVYDNLPICSSWNGFIIIFSESSATVIYRSDINKKVTIPITGDQFSPWTESTQYIFFIETPYSITFYVRDKAIGSLNNGGYLTISIDEYMSLSSAKAVFKKIKYTGVLGEVKGLSYFRQRILLLVGGDLFLSKVVALEEFTDLPASSTDSTAPYKITVTPDISKEILLSIESTQDAFVITTSSNYYIYIATDDPSPLLAFKVYFQAHDGATFSKSYQMNGKVYSVSDNKIDCLDYIQWKDRFIRLQLAGYCQQFFSNKIMSITHRELPNGMYIDILFDNNELVSFLVSKDGNPKLAAPFKQKPSPVQSNYQDGSVYADMTHGTKSIISYYKDKFYLEIIPERLATSVSNVDPYNFEYIASVDIKTRFETNDFLDKSVCFHSLHLTTLVLQPDGSWMGEYRKEENLADFVVGAIIEFLYVDPITSDLKIVNYKISSINIVDDGDYKILTLRFSSIGDEPFDIVIKGPNNKDIPNTLRVHGIIKKHNVPVKYKEIYKEFYETNSLYAKCYSKGKSQIINIKQDSDWDEIPEALVTRIGIGYRSMVRFDTYLDPRIDYSITNKVSVTMRNTIDGAMNMYVAQDTSGIHDYNKIDFVRLLSGISDDDIRLNRSKYPGIQQFVPSKMTLNRYDIKLPCQLSPDKAPSIYFFSTIGLPITILNVSMRF